MNKKITLSLLLFSLVCSVGASYAWFRFNKKLTIDSNENYSVGVGYNLEMAYLQSDGTWSDYGKKFEFTSPRLQDVTGNGMTFGYPYSLDDNDNPSTQLRELTSEDSDREGYYLEFYFKIKTNYDLNIYLSNNSYVSPLSTIENMSIYGDFTANYICAAARVSVCEETFTEDPSTGVVTFTNEKLKTIWVPNAYYQLSIYSSSSAGFTTNGSREDTYGYLVNDGSGADITTKKITYGDTDYLSKKISYGSLADITTGYVNNAKEVLEFENKGVNQEKAICVRLWIEGTDREAHGALNQGKIKYHSEFCGIEKGTDDATSNANLLNIKPKAYDGKLYHCDGDNYVEITEEDGLLFASKLNGNYQPLTSSQLVDYYAPNTEKDENGVEIDNGHNTTVVYIKYKETYEKDYYSISKIDLKNLTTSLAYQKGDD